MAGETVEGLMSYHLSPIRAPDATAIVRDEMFETLRTKWDLRWYFLHTDEYPDCSILYPPGTVIGLTAVNNQEMVSGLGGYRLELHGKLMGHYRRTKMDPQVGAQGYS
jgi:hypothetical protein